MITKEKIEELKQVRIAEILDDTTISSLKKLELLTEEELFGYAEYVQDEFPEWEKEAIELERIEAQKLFDNGKETWFFQSKMVDTIWACDGYTVDRYIDITYAELLGWVSDNYCDETDNDADIEKENPMITIMTTRRPCIELKKPFNEIVDKIFDFCIANKIIGFKNDW
jgi:hypothetical protein